jgi:hypothetical protein
MSDYTAVKDQAHANDLVERWGVLHNNEFAGFGARDFAERVASQGNFDPEFNESDWTTFIREPVIAYNPTNRSVILGDGYVR